LSIVTLPLCHTLRKNNDFHTSFSLCASSFLSLSQKGASNHFIPPNEEKIRTLPALLHLTFGKAIAQETRKTQIYIFQIPLKL
jgi:hypothetical protein